MKKRSLLLTAVLLLNSCNLNTFISEIMSELNKESEIVSVVEKESSLVSIEESEKESESKKESAKESESIKESVSDKESAKESESIKESVSEKESISEKESVSEKESESVSVVEEITEADYYINSKYVTKTIKSGSLYYSQNSNIIIMDNNHRLVYTVGNAGSSYGKLNKSYYLSSYSSNVSDNYVKVASGATAYVLNNTGYGIFVNELSCGYIPVNDIYSSTTNIESWNSKSNEYIEESTTICVVDSVKYKQQDIDCINDNIVRLSSIKDTTTDNIVTYKMIVPYTDSYTIKASNCTISLYELNSKLINSKTSTMKTSLNENDIVYLQLEGTSLSSIDLTVEATNRKVELPYQINSGVDTSSYSTKSTSTTSSLKASQIKYTKRNDNRGLYINSNNPERLSTTDLNKCLCSQDVTEKDVFFTFEHNNLSTNFYYGYRVTNKGSNDLYITVKNLGFQCSGKGSWLGEDEWTKFYNVSFRSKSELLSNSNWVAYVGFANTYTSANRQPITYRIPAGKYIYVMGGTTADSYLNTNVFNSANIKVNGGCGNGAVLFSTHGSEAYGEFVIYNNVSTLNTNIKADKEQGYVTLRSGTQYGQQYIGYDNCHGVVDADLVWQFNDATFKYANNKAVSLPVAYSNPYYTTTSSGTAYGETKNRSTQTFTNATSWNTHINPQYTKTAVGTDMTYYRVTDANTNKEICIDPWHYDGRGEYANIGNWMVDYIDNITLVNQSSKDRVFTYTLTFAGVILAYVRNMDGTISDTISPRYYCILAASSYGSAVNDPFVYTVTVKANSILQFAINYNLLANSYGNISHQATIK